MEIKSMHLIHQSVPLCLVTELHAELAKIQLEQEKEAQAEREEQLRQQQLLQQQQQQQQQAAMAWAHDPSRSGPRMGASLLQIQQEETQSQMVSLLTNQCM